MDNKKGKDAMDVTAKSDFRHVSRDLQVRKLK